MYERIRYTVECIKFSDSGLTMLCNNPVHLFEKSDVYKTDLCLRPNGVNRPLRMVVIPNNLKLMGLLFNFNRRNNTDRIIVIASC